MTSRQVKVSQLWEEKKKRMNSSQGEMKKQEAKQSSGGHPVPAVLERHKAEEEWRAMDEERRCDALEDGLIPNTNQLQVRRLRSSINFTVTTFVLACSELSVQITVKRK